MTTTALPESTREQDTFAEEQALHWETVECSRLDDGNLLVVCRGDLNPDADARTAHTSCRIHTVDRDGQPLDLSEGIARSKARSADALVEVEALDPQADDYTEQVRALAIRAEDDAPQMHELLAVATPMVATRRHVTKGGVAMEVGDVVLRLPEYDYSQPGFRPVRGVQDYVTVYSFRRGCNVSTPRTGYLRER